MVPGVIEGGPDIDYTLHLYDVDDFMRSDLVATILEHLLPSEKKIDVVNMSFGYSCNLLEAENL